MKLKTNRKLFKYILLNIVTLGIYNIVVMSGISEDINIIAGNHDKKKTMHYCLLAFVFSWMTLGIAPLVWFHRLSKRIGKELKRRKISYKFGSGSFWGWNILGIVTIVGPLVYTHKLFRSMNLIAADFNEKG